MPKCKRTIYGHFILFLILLIPVIPIILSESHGWQASVVGLLIAGQLYISCAKDEEFKDKLKELNTSVKSKIFKNETGQNNNQNSAVQIKTEIVSESNQPPKYFLSNDVALTHVSYGAMPHNCWISLQFS